MDNDLIRSLLLQLKNGMSIEYCSDVVAHHLNLIQQAGWIDGDVLYLDGRPYGPMKLNWSGHEIADLLSDEFKWEQLKAKENLEFSFTIIIDLMKVNEMNSDKPVLMSSENHDGLKLEDLLVKVKQEVSEKINKIINDPSPQAQIVVRNNLAIIEHLGAAEALQRTSYVGLDAMRTKFLTCFIFLRYKDTNDLVFDEFFLYMARGAGKNGFVSALVNYFISELHGIDFYNVSIVANSEKQAKTSFTEVYNVIDMNDDLKAYFKHQKAVIESIDTKSIFQFHTSNASTKDGLRDGCVVYDEVHEYENNEVVDVFSGGLGKVKDSREFLLVQTVLSGMDL